MRLSDYLHSTVLLLAATSLVLELTAAIGFANESSAGQLVFTAAWLIVSVAIGLWMGRNDQVMESIREIISRSRPEPIFPKIEPAAVLFSRLWPVLLTALVCAFASLALPTVAGVAGGYGLMWALAWRKQAGAVEAIEDRDAVHFWIVRSSPFRPMKVVRVPAM